MKLRSKLRKVVERNVSEVPYMGSEGKQMAQVIRIELTFCLLHVV